MVRLTPQQKAILMQASKRINMSISNIVRYFVNWGIDKLNSNLNAVNSNE